MLFIKEDDLAANNEYAQNKNIKETIRNYQQKLNNLLISSPVNSKEVYALSVKLDRLINNCYIHSTN